MMILQHYEYNDWRDLGPHELLERADEHALRYARAAGVSPGHRFRIVEKTDEGVTVLARGVLRSEDKIAWT